MSEKQADDLVEDEKEETNDPIEVTIKKTTETPVPDFDYDDYLPTDEEIIEAEKEINENAEKRKVKNA